MSGKIVPAQSNALGQFMPALEEAKAFAKASIPKNTQRAYASDWNQFSEWCEASHQQEMPAKPETVAAYIASLTKTHRCSTLRRKLAAISKAHSLKGFPNPCSAAPVKNTMKGIEATLGSRPNGKAPVTHDALNRMIDSYEGKTGLDTFRAKAILLVGFAGAFRRSELCDLRLSDLTWHHEGVVILLRKSKTDQRGEGQQKAIPYVPGRLCAAKALAEWVRYLPPNADQPVFCGFDRDGLPGKKPLSPQTVALIVKGAAHNAGLDASVFSGHSLRSGHVTEARARGVADSATMQTTGHKRVETLEMYDRRNNPFQKGSAGDVLKFR
jgi:site-specific recombinase XerD